MMKIIASYDPNSDNDWRVYCWEISGVLRGDSSCNKRNKWGDRRRHIRTLFYWKVGQAHVRLSWKSHSTHTCTNTYTPSWVPLLFLPPWRRGHWHGFLSLVSLTESRSLFSGLISQCRAAWTLDLCLSSSPLWHFTHLNRQGLIAQCTHTHTQTKT